MTEGNPPQLVHVDESYSCVLGVASTLKVTCDVQAQAEYDHYFIQMLIYSVLVLYIYELML